ncbi:MAG TPA: prenyltransferase/squalene oxidase repeat-containing protein [Pirellulales bacterium]
MPTFVWLLATLVGSGVVATALLVYWSPSHEKQATPVAMLARQVQPAVKSDLKTDTTIDDKSAASSRQTPSKTAPSESDDHYAKPLPQPVEADHDETAAGTQADATAQSSPTKPDKPLGIVADRQKRETANGTIGLVADEPTGVLGDAPSKPETLAVPDEPKLAVVADTAKGLYAERTQPKTSDWLGERGGTAASQQAVEDGLDWLARHQATDGHWGADCLGTGLNSRCDRVAPCDGLGEAYEAAHTGLALLAFQAAGHYYFNGQKYSGQVKKGLDYLFWKQSVDGSIVGSQVPTPEQADAGIQFPGCFMYEHAVATFALCEACAVAIAAGKKPDPRYQLAAQRAVSFIEEVQHDDGGWRYTVNAKDVSDSSVSGWAMLALKTAREAELRVSPQTISKMMDFFATHYSDGRTHYLRFGNAGSDALTGVGMMAVVFFEHKLDSPVVQSGAARLAVYDIAGRPDYYSWYNCTMAMFQVGGEPWNRWNDVHRDSVIGLQVQGEACERGSWPPNDRWGKAGGRIYSTALAVLTLEVYYRFQRIAGQPQNEQSLDK